MPYFHAASRIASRSGVVVRLAPDSPRRGQNDIAPHKYIPLDGSDSLPPALAEAVRKYPGPCAYWGRWCDDEPFAEPMTERPSPDGATGLDGFTDDEFAANAAIVAAEQAEFERRVAERRAADKAAAEAAAAWHAANRGRLVAEYVADVRARQAAARSEFERDSLERNNYTQGFPATYHYRAQAAAAGVDPRPVHEADFADEVASRFAADRSAPEPARA